MPSVDVLTAGATGALAAGAAGVLTQLVQAVRHRGKDRSEGEKVVVDAAREVVSMLRAELHDQEERHRAEMTRLREQLKEALAEAATARAEAESAQAEVTKLKRDLAAAGASRPPPQETS